MRITHIYHSGVLIEFGNKQIFIDVISDVSMYIDKNKKIYFLATHVHGDHFDKMIFSYKEYSAKYILSDDIKVEEEAIYVSEKNEYKIDDLIIKTYGTTDRGVSFFINCDNNKIFHSGDLNWWHWGNNSKESQKQEEIDFKREVGYIKEKEVDVIFAPVDPKLGEYYYLAGKHFIEEFNVKNFIPIHFRDEFDITKKFRKRYSDLNVKIHEIKSRNHVIEI